MKRLQKLKIAIKNEQTKQCYVTRSLHADTRGHIKTAWLPVYAQCIIIWRICKTKDILHKKAFVQL